MLIVSSYKYSLTPCPLYLESTLERTLFLRKTHPGKGLYKRGSGQLSGLYLGFFFLRKRTEIYARTDTPSHAVLSASSGSEATNRDVPVADVHAGPGGPRVRELGGNGGHRAPGQVPLVAARRRPGLGRGGAEPARIGDESEGAGGLPRWEL